MTDTEAKDLLRRLFAVLPAAQAYYQKNVSADQKQFVFAAWVKVLTRYDVETAEAALNQLVETANNPTITMYPVQALLDEIKRNAPKVKADVSPCDRSPRDSNMLESYLAGRAKPDRIDEILEAVL